MYEYGTSRGWAPRMSLTAREIERNVRQRAALRREAETKRRVAPLVAQRLALARAFGEGDRIEVPDGRTGSFAGVDEISGAVLVSLGLRVASYNPEVLKKTKPD